MSQQADYVALEEDKEESGNVDEAVVPVEPPPPEPKKPSKLSVWLEMLRTDINLPKISNMQDLKVLKKWQKLTGKAYIKSRQFKNSFKSTLAIVASSLFSLIGPVNQVIGPTGFMVSIAVLQFDMTVNLGGLLENFVIVVLCVSIPAFLAYIALHISLHSPLGILSWAFGYYFFSMWVKTFMAQRWQVPISIGQEAYMFCVVLGHRAYQFSGIDQSGWTVFNLAKNSIIGATLSLLFTACLFPHSATRALRSEMIVALKAMSTLLQLNSKMVFNEATAQECLELKQLLSASTKRITTIANLCMDVEMEINQGLLSPKEYNKALQILKRLFRHLSAMSRAGMSLQDSEDHSDANAVAFSLTRSLNLRATMPDSAITDILKSLRAPISALNKCCFEVIQTSATKFENTPTGLRHLLDRLQAELDVYDLNLQITIGDLLRTEQHTEVQSEKLHRIFCFLFSHREFGDDLVKLVNCLNSSNNEPQIHLPSYKRRIENFFATVAANDQKKDEILEFGCGLQTGSSDDRKTWGYYFWNLSTKITTPNTSFAFRTALLILLVSIPAFLPETKQFYKDWRGEWVVFTIIVTVSPSFGADAVLSKWRVVGSIFGGLAAVLTTLACGHNPYLLFLGVVLFVFPVNFVRLASPKYQRLAMISIFTFLLVLLGKYTGQFKEEIWLVATRRALAICLGVTLVMIFSRMFWPLLARRELRLQLSHTVHNVALLYSKTISMFLNVNNQVKSVTKLEDSVQVSLLRMQTLLDQAKVEPRIKGPFPIHVYAQMLESIQISTDILLSIRLLIMRGFSGKLRETIVIPLNQYRKDLVISILTLFWIVGEALNSKRPIPHHLQDSKMLLKRVSNAFRKLMNHNKQNSKDWQPSNDIILFSAYLKLLKDFVTELNHMLGCTKKLFGGSEFIDGLFIIDEKAAFRASGEYSPANLTNNNHE